MRLCLLSTSTVHGSGFLDYAEGLIRTTFADVEGVLFVPLARPGGRSEADYTALVRDRLGSMGFAVDGLDEVDDPVAAVEEAEAVYVGGGNTFVLLDGLYRTGVLDPIRRRVRAGLPYLGASAGSNVAGPTVGTTNDMPIVEPPSFDAFGLIPFNINPHYLDPDPDSTHQGETRETRIVEFHAFNRQPVLGLREGAALHVRNGEATLVGDASARLFRRGRDPEELSPGVDLSFLLDDPD